MQEYKYNLNDLKEQREYWKTVCTDMMSDSDKEYYEKRKKAVDMYINGYSLIKIEKETGCYKQNIKSYVEKCIQIDPNTNEPFGYTALIRYKRTKRDSKIKIDKIQNSRGAFNKLVLKYPQLQFFIEKTYFNKSKKSLSKDISITNLHNLFLDKCIELGILDYEYPFNTADKGKRSLYRYVKELEISNLTLASNRLDKDSKQKLLSTGTGNVMRPAPLAPLSVVQIDGHLIDALYTVDVKNKHGEIIKMEAMRLWLITVIDVSTRAIINYHLTPEENYNQFDILNALRNSIMPKKKIEFKTTTLNYPDNIGYPSIVFPELQWALPETIMLDNAKSHLAKNVIKKLCDELHISLNYGSVATPEVRGIVERCFGTLEQKGFHRLPSTTGSNPKDNKRKDAEKDAVKYKISYEDLHELTEYFIAVYNNSPHSALDNQTPLECLKRRLKDAGMLPVIAKSDDMKQKVYNLTTYTEEKTIRGCIEVGKRPYITFKGVEYRNDILASTGNLIGKKIIIEVNPNNIQTVHAYFENGAELGILYAKGEWGRRPHSLKTRNDILKLSNKNKNEHNPFYAPLSDYEKTLNERAESERRARTKAARIRKEQNKELNKEVIKTEIIDINTGTPKYLQDIYISSHEKRKETLTAEELDELLNSDSLEDALKNRII